MASCRKLKSLLLRARACGKGEVRPLPEIGLFSARQEGFAASDWRTDAVFYPRSDCYGLIFLLQ